MNERPPQIEKQKIWPWPMSCSWKFTFSAARSVDFGSTRQKIAAIFLCNRRRLVHQSSSKIKRSVSFHRKPGGEYLTRSIYGCTVSCKSKRLTISFYKLNYIHYLTPWIIWRPVEDETSEESCFVFQWASTSIVETPTRLERMLLITELKIILIRHWTRAIAWFNRVKHPNFKCK